MYFRQGNYLQLVQIYQGIHGLPKTGLQQKHYISLMERKQKQFTANEAVLLKIASLERQLKHEELRNVVLDMLIDVVEKKLNITIRKSLATNSLRN